MQQRLLGGVFGVAVAAGIASGQQLPRLPEPSGPDGIGRTAVEWVDKSRLDPFTPDRKEFRRVMAYLWYPTASDQKTDRGVYLPGAQQIEVAPGFDRSRFGRAWPLIVSGTITSHARDNGSPAPHQTRWPVVVFSHGSGTTSFSYTSAIEDLVSHGYVVAAVEHPYTSAAVVFPDGQVIFNADRADRPRGLPYFEGVELGMRTMRQSAGVQAADLSFALDQLTQSDTSGTFSLKDRLDLSRVAVAGHSHGGQAATRACQNDVRFKACVNLDGGTPDGVFLQYPGAAPLTQPLLYVEATPAPTFTDQQLTERGISRTAWDRNATNVADTQERQLRSGLAGGYKVVLRAPGINHSSFEDIHLSASTPEAEQRALHKLCLTTDLTRAFLDKYLKNQDSTLLDPRNAGNPEVVVTPYPAAAR